MSEIEQQDYTHRKPVLDDFEIPLESLGDHDHQACKKTVNREVNIDAQAHAESALSPPSRKQVKKARIQFITLCWTLFLAGWNDASTGPLLPRIQEVYHVTFS
jgi:hypothetical protein